MLLSFEIFFFFFFNDTATTEIYTLSLHDALPISRRRRRDSRLGASTARLPPGSSANPSLGRSTTGRDTRRFPRSEEHTSELQSLAYLVCRLLLEKKKKKQRDTQHCLSVQDENSAV